MIPVNYEIFCGRVIQLHVYVRRSLVDYVHKLNQRLAGWLESVESDTAIYDRRQKRGDHKGKCQRAIMSTYRLSPVLTLINPLTF